MGNILLNLFKKESHYMWALVLSVAMLLVTFGCDGKNSEIKTHLADPSAKDNAGESCGLVGMFNDKLQEIDGPRAVARVGAVGDMAIDSGKNLYFTDEAYHTIREIKVNGEVVRIAGQSGEYGCNDGKKVDAHLFNPYGLAIDKTGTVFFYDHHMIRKAAPDGSVTTIAGASNTVGANDGKGAQASFWSYQVKMTIDRDGNLYIGDQSAVRKIAPDGVVTTLAGVANRGASRVDGRGAHARFKTISSIVIDHANNIYVLDDGVIRKIDRSGEVTTIEGSSQTSLGVPYAKSLTMHCAAASLAIDRSDNLYLGSYGAIRKIEPTGKVETLFDLDIDCSDNRGSDAGIISFPSAMAVDDEGNVYGFGARGLFKVTPSRELSLVLDRAFR